MTRPGLGGLTAMGALVLALGGGIVGGALTTGGQTPAEPVTTLHQVAGEAAPAPVPSGAEEVPSAPSIPAVNAVEPVTTTAPVPVAVVGGSGETAGEAADRAEDAADRAEKAADRAESGSAPKPTSAPAEEDPVKPEPKPDTKAEPKSCVYDVRQTHRHGAMWVDFNKQEGGRQYQVRYRCEDGKVVELSRQSSNPEPDPGVVVEDAADAQADAEPETVAAG